MVHEYKERVLTYGIRHAADITACDIKESIQGTFFKVNTTRGSFSIESRLIGEYNVYNMLAAIGFAISIDLPVPLIKRAITGFKGAPGRMERIDPGSREISVFVDYAHTDDALFNVLNALNTVKQNRIITVFGCGGNRDRQKRPRMSRVAAELSGYIIITNDNPRNENPKDIIDDILKGLPEGFNDYKVLMDRKKAIEHSLSIAEKGDIVLIAGKGHENHQISKGITKPFDDRKIAYELLQKNKIEERV
jgi:UDP-N-acetylmuramoyl-L-alanyl-D-glutamate--2,6-diaminopimelate ligase